MVALNIGMFGGGTVGGGVYEIVEQTKKAFFQSLGVDATISKICVRNLDKERSFTIGEHTMLVTDFNEILEDDNINCVVELIGGVTHAKDVVFRALQAGKHVVTANKALLAQFLPEVMELVENTPGVLLGYEAAVCGGIPIIHNMQHSYVGDEISSVMGIMNGTTNFMLTKMELEGADYGTVLKEAQDLGFAEADPTADVEGFDVQAKIALLAKLAFGQNVPVESVPCAGISKLTSADFTCAKMMDCTIKLVGTATTLGDGRDRLAVYVSPVVVPLGSPLASARGPGNIVVVGSKNLTESVYTGPGAGRYPTANSVVNDVVRMAQGLCSRPFPLSQEWRLESDFSARFYVRVPAEDSAGVLPSVVSLAEGVGISVQSVRRVAPCSGKVEIVATTEDCKRSQVQTLCEQAAEQAWAQGEPVWMSLL
ncbi:unnamed protein product [Choristocarpus tenellus]